MTHSEAVGPAGRRAIADRLDAWLAGLLPDVPGVALVAVGSLGRRDCVPGSDVDLVLVHDGLSNVAEIADKVWYPVWDSGVGLDHSVRTLKQAAKVAGEDVRAALGMLDARYVAGDRDLAVTFGARLRAAWRADAARNLAALRESSLQRWERYGELAFLLEGDLKEARGGLRDLLAIRGAGYAQVAEGPSPAAREAYERLLDVRHALHEVTGRGKDTLRLQEQENVAQRLGLADSDALLRRVADDARSIAYAAETCWLAVERWSAGRRRLLRRGKPDRRPLADGVVEQDGEVVLAREARPDTDALLPLRVAAAAAHARLPISTHTLSWLARSRAELPVPWPAAARQTLVSLLGTGEAAVPVWEACDRHGLVERWLPEWSRVRSLPQRNPMHRFTVDRHLVEAATQAARHTRRVSRPDLLLVGSLLHDIGKGLPGDHSVEGAPIAAAYAQRMGFDAADVEVIRRLVRRHLTLPQLATRRDLDDPVTIQAAAEAVGHDQQVLDLLYALTEADSVATGAGVWTDWRAGLVSTLVERTHALIGEGELPDPPPLGSQLLALADSGELAVWVDDSAVTVVAPDSRGLLAAAAGVLTVHRLEVLSADARTVAGMAVVVLVAQPRFGSWPDATLLSGELRRAIRGELDVSRRIGAMRRSYRPSSAPPPRVVWVAGAASAGTVLELRAADSPGLLYRVTAALESVGAKVDRARVSTFGVDAVDTFYLDGSYADPAARDLVDKAVLTAADPTA
ncbi:[protein-PII] uridylyltransferase [Fodinicola acaciae]|uniref:[protein-PII] uridylyltransferase n=1 Tax=Fodinicola acaciae TaxID=2681555 RepID=UPI0013D432EF|nr:[protein-PII] uridylyltransferase [Fodinicola acaciae]